jgi:hypothetical protein
MAGTMKKLLITFLLAQLLLAGMYTLQGTH